MWRAKIFTPTIYLCANNNGACWRDKEFFFFFLFPGSRHRALFPGFLLFFNIWQDAGNLLVPPWLSGTVQRCHLDYYLSELGTRKNCSDNLTLLRTNNLSCLITAEYAVDVEASSWLQGTNDFFIFSVIHKLYYIVALTFVARLKNWHVPTSNIYIYCSSLSD